MKSDAHDSKYLEKRIFMEVDRRTMHLESKMAQMQALFESSLIDPVDETPLPNRTRSTAVVESAPGATHPTGSLSSATPERISEQRSDAGSMDSKTSAEGSRGTSIIGKLVGLVSPGGWRSGGSKKSVQGED